MKHAGASQVQVRLGRTDEAIILEIRDTGEGTTIYAQVPAREVIRM